MIKGFQIVEVNKINVNKFFGENGWTFLLQEEIVETQTKPTIYVLRRETAFVLSHMFTVNQTDTVQQFKVAYVHLSPLILMMFNENCVHLTF